MTLIDCLAKQAKEQPDQLAVVCGGYSLSYRELDELSSRAAYALVKKGVRKGDPVGINTDHDERSVLSVYAIIKAGGAFVPLNPILPETRVSFIKRDAGIEYVIGHDADIRELADTASFCELPAINRDDRIAVIYTSGSTGEPKGVALLHKNPLAAANQYNETMGITKGCNIACYVSLSFIVALNDIASAVTAGAALHFIPGDIRLVMRDVADYFTQKNIVSALLPVSFGRKLADNANLPALKSLGLCGERFIAPKAQSYEVFNVYGTTEICGAQFAGPGAVRSIGAATAKIEDGELAVSGDCVAYGYMNGRQFNGKYNTGDLAEVTPEGFMIKGRKDFQIKIRGYRIEPNEIDIKALSVDGVSESVTVKRNERLINFFSGSTNAEEIKSALSRELPKYMIPGKFVQLEALPKTLTGKIDRGALPDVIDRVPDTLPDTETEKRLASIWSDVLETSLNSIGLYDNFEKHGGDSLNVLMLSFEIEMKFGVTVTPGELFQAKNICEQAKLIERCNTRRVHAFRETGSGDPLWFVHTANSGSEVYRKFAIRLPETQRFCVFENQNVLFGDKEFEGIRELARRYISYLPKADFYSLGGWSFGGIIAFEMGLQLQNLGGKTRLFLIDPSIGQAPNNSDYRKYLESDPLFERFRTMGLIDKLERNNTFVLQEIAAYIPSAVYSGKVLLFRMTKEGKAWDNGFSNYANDLKIVNINQTHDRALTDEYSISIIVNEILL